MSKVTIAIPTYNRPEYLVVAIKSILNQTFQNFEIIIFDNGSNYNVQEYISGFKDSRIKLETNVIASDGATNYKRILTYKYNTEYLVIFHDDDAMHPQLIENELIHMEANSGLVWIGTGLNFVHDQSNINKFKILKKTNKFKIFNSTELIRLILKNFNLAFNTVMYRTDHLEDASQFNMIYNKWFDRPYLVHLSKKGKVGIINEQLVNYRIHHGQDSQTKSVDGFKFLINLCDYYYNNLPLPLNKGDKRLFYTWSTNNLIKTISDFSDNFKVYLSLFKKYKTNNLINIKYLNYRGVWYLIKVINKYFFKLSCH